MTTPAIHIWEGPYAVLSNFSAHEVEYEGVRYKTSEHAYQASKFEDTTIREKIKNAPSAFLAREYGQTKDGRKKDFDKVLEMKKIMRAKLDQHADVRRALLETGGAVIEKNHPRDVFWGIGADGSGQNVMGRIWMELRGEFDASSF